MIDKIEELTASMVVKNKRKSLTGIRDLKFEKDNNKSESDEEERVEDMYNDALGII